MRVPSSNRGNVRPIDRTQGFISGASNADAVAGGQVAQATAGIGAAIGNLGQFLEEQDRNRRRVATLKSFSDFQLNVNEQLAEAQRSLDPAISNFSDQWKAQVNNFRSEWLDTVDRDLREEFDLRSTEFENTSNLRAQEIQYRSTDAYFKTVIQDSLSQTLVELDQDGSGLNLDRQVGLMQELIQSTALTESEKVSYMRQAVIAMSSVSYRTEIREGQIASSALGVGQGPVGTAIDLIKEFGGSALENDLSYEQNEEMLAQRLEYAEQALVQQIGSLDRWSALPSRARAALLSLVDDVENVPETVVQAIKSGNLSEVARAVEVLGGERRKTEADIIRGVEGMPESDLDTDPRYIQIPYEDRLLLRADADRQAVEINKNEALAQKAQLEAARNELFVGLYDGQLGEMEIQTARESGVLTQFEDIKKAYGIIDAQNSNNRLIADGLNYLNTGSTMNPGNAEHMKQLNAIVGDVGLQALEGKDGNYVRIGLVPIVDASQIIPTAIRQKIAGMVRSSDPSKVSFAFDTLAQLDQAAPDAFAGLSENLRQDYSFWTETGDYYTQEERVAYIQGGITADARQNKTMLEQEARDVLSGPEKDFDIVQQLSDNPRWRWGEPAVTPGARQALDREYRQLFIREYARDGDAEGAKSRATKALMFSWGVTDIGGGQNLMKLPPEFVGYPAIDGNYDWITEQVRTDFELADDQNFQLVSDDRTENEYRAFTYGVLDPNGQPVIPSYLVFYMDSDGVFRADDSNRTKFDISPDLEAVRIRLHQAASSKTNNTELLRLMEKVRQDVTRTGQPAPANVVEDLMIEGKTMELGL